MSPFCLVRQLPLGLTFSSISHYVLKKDLVTVTYYHAFNLCQILQIKTKITRVGAQGHVLHLFLPAIEVAGNLNLFSYFLRFCSWQSERVGAHSSIFLFSKNILLDLKLTVAQWRQFAICGYFSHSAFWFYIYIYF